MSNDDNGQLIALLEQEMRDSLVGIDESESEITLELVREWYLATEKIIRVGANILSVPMQQAINQLRYAGHHILKAQTSQVQGVKDANTIEAFKHCKRALYDALDFYVYQLHEIYRTKIMVLPRIYSDNLEAQSFDELKEKFKELMDGINRCRLKSEHRIEYYNAVYQGMIDGLNWINQVESLLCEYNITDEVFKEKQHLVMENEALRQDNKIIADKNTELENTLTKKFIRPAVIFSVLFAVTIGLSPLISDWLVTIKHEITYKMSANTPSPSTVPPVNRSAAD